MNRIDFDRFTSSVLTYKKALTKIEFLTQSGYGLNAFLISVSTINLSYEEALSLLCFRMACFFEEWDPELFQNKENLEFLYKVYFNPLFSPCDVEDFWRRYEILVDGINDSTKTINEKTKKCNDLYLGSEAIKFPEMQIDGSFQVNPTTLSSNDFIRYNDIVECFCNREVCLQTSYFIITEDKYFLLNENIRC